MNTWQGEGWYTFRNWIHYDGEFVVEDWESPEKPLYIWIEDKEQFLEAVLLPEGMECVATYYGCADVPSPEVAQNIRLAGNMPAFLLSNRF